VEERVQCCTPLGWSVPRIQPVAGITSQCYAWHSDSKPKPNTNPNPIPNPYPNQKHRPGGDATYAVANAVGYPGQALAGEASYAVASEVLYSRGDAAAGIAPIANPMYAAQPAGLSAGRSTAPTDRCKKCNAKKQFCMCNASNIRSQGSRNEGKRGSRNGKQQCQRIAPSGNNCKNAPVSGFDFCKGELWLKLPPPPPFGRAPTSC
jgi:hypothetical protein